ncbi:carboxylate--amine ligase [Seongchinamella sediminis]|uniref:Carboxylate--amine ligase n=1 Tax=Seongchinamella sediminis TaxID=2283635 RepID=A0A3L7DYD2_9GAMM|nr:RimK family protein [Seongchinamella sediminis]RLQ22618.1 carboxylate--amine ligase [Seongchinamella sediminis]
MEKTLIVVDDPAPFRARNIEVIDFDTYLHDYPRQGEGPTRVINLCSTEHYLSRGYYCSLLAEAREHRVLPSVKTINALRLMQQDAGGLIQVARDHRDLASGDLAGTHLLLFGNCPEPRLADLARQVFLQYPAPILELTLTEAGDRMDLVLRRLSVEDLDDAGQQSMLDELESFARVAWRRHPRRKVNRWDMAILVNPDEKVPPSNREAIKRFIKSAARHNIHAEAVQAGDLGNISQYDALFIREGTAINHHSYELACRAEDAGLVVIDDPTSILRCCNKVFLHDAFDYRGVPSLRTEVVADASPATVEHLEQTFGYPMVLKLPEGSFSSGVFKATDRAELEQRLSELLDSTALVLAQEYLYTEYDWRIGVLNGRALFACRYMMARNHWQIYNHDARRDFSGDFETLATFEVPRPVLDSALKACAIIGNGLYGVDIKYHQGKAYVIEVNDNPSIDHRVEDAYLGRELYMQVMGEFQRRLEARGR